MRNRVLVIAGIVVIILSVLLIRTCSTPSDKGEIVYKQHCANCHGDNGEGFAMYPPLNEADYLVDSKEDFACIVMYGLSDTIMVNGKSYNQPMPANLDLSETDITNLANYVYRTFAQEPHTFTKKEIEERLEKCLNP